MAKGKWQVFSNHFNGGKFIALDELRIPTNRCMAVMLSITMMRILLIYGPITKQKKSNLRKN